MNSPHILEVSGSNLNWDVSWLKFQLLSLVFSGKCWNINVKWAMTFLAV